MDACVARCSLCGVAETSPSSKGGRLIQTSSRPRSSRLQHPGCNTAQGSPQAAQVHSPASPAALRIISWQLFVLCMRVTAAMFRRRPWAATHPIKPSRSSPSRPSKETTWPSAQSLGLDRDACHTLCLSNPTLYSLTAVVHDLHMHRCRTHTTHWQIGRLGEVCDVSIVSPKFRCRPELPDTRREGARCWRPLPRREACDRVAHICTPRSSIGAVGSI